MDLASKLHDGLKQFATPTQLTYLEAVMEHGIEGATRKTGRHRSTIQESLHTLLTKAAAKGVHKFPMEDEAVPDPFIMKGQSILSRMDPETGQRKPVLVWDKTRVDDVEWMNAVKAGVSAFIDDASVPLPLPRQPHTPKLDTDIIPWIQIGDAHLGMLAHEAETGSNFDLKIAEAELTAAIGILIDELPLVERLVINDLGDFTHYENMAGVTDHSGHALDYDGRFPKMITVYSRLMRRIIEMALTKAKNVDVIINQGNHSRTNDIWMAELIRATYGHSDRVNVIDNTNVFIGYRMGRTFVMTHHSDKCKPKDLANVMATDFRRDWGEADYCYVDIGHIHHNMVSKEHPGAQIESWNILASRDKFAHDGGWRSRQSISVVFRSRQYGEIGRRRLGIREVHDTILRTAHGKDHYIPKEVRAHTV